MLRNIDSNSMFVFRNKYLSLCLACLLFLIATVPVQAATTTIIPYLDTGYKYQITTFNGVPGFELPNYDDSGFFVGNAGFGTQTGGCSLNNPTDAKTNWPTGTDILLRKEFNLPPGSSNLKVSVAIDNDVQVFINGVDISGGLKPHENCPTLDSFVFTAPNNLLNAGTNVLAVRGRDRGSVSYLDAKVTVESNSNSIPEFPSIGMPVVAVIGLMFLFQRRKGKE